MCPGCSLHSRPGWSPETMGSGTPFHQPDIRRSSRSGITRPSVANSLIFLLIGTSMPQQHFGDLWLPGLVAILLVTLGRAVAIYPICALFSRSSRKVRIPEHVYRFGEVCAVSALALALGLPVELPLHDQIVTISFGVVAFSIFAQGLTMTPLLRKLGQLHAASSISR